MYWRNDLHIAEKKPTGGQTVKHVIQLV